MAGNRDAVEEVCGRIERRQEAAVIREGDRLRVLARAAPPDGCSSVIPVAPAAAPSVSFRDVHVVQTDNGPRLRSTTTPGHHAARRSGPLEVMEHLAARRRAKNPLTFDVGQHAAAIEYVALAEFCASSGVKLSSLDGGGGGGDVAGRMDRVIQNITRMRAMRAAMGDGMALVARRGVIAAEAQARHQADRGRSPVSVAAVVDGVLLHGRSIAVVLDRHGWTRQTPYVKAAQHALGAALTRMYGL